jgi:hypothetical protein
MAEVLDTEARPTNVAAGPQVSQVIWWAWRLQMSQEMHGTFGWWFVCVPKCPPKWVPLTEIWTCGVHAESLMDSPACNTHGAPFGYTMGE